MVNAQNNEPTPSNAQKHKKYNSNGNANGLKLRFLNTAAGEQS